MSLISIDGHDKAPQHLPIGSLKLFGTNPYNEPMFRVVWSESRFYLVGAEHHVYDDSAGGASKDAVLIARGKDPNRIKAEVGYKWLPLYPNLKAWILELWKSPTAATGCFSKEQYAIEYTDPTTGLLLLGPYPSRGEYYQSHVFKETPTFDTVGNVINMIRAGWNYSYIEHKQANEKLLESKERDKTRNFMDLFLDAQQAFGNKPTNIRPGKKTKDGVKIKHSAESLRVPVRGGLAVGSRRGPNAGNNRTTRAS